MHISESHSYPHYQTRKVIIDFSNDGYNRVEYPFFCLFSGRLIKNDVFLRVMKNFWHQEDDCSVITAC